MCRHFPDFDEFVKFSATIWVALIILRRAFRNKKICISFKVQSSNAAKGTVVSYRTKECDCPESIYGGKRICQSIISQIVSMLNLHLFSVLPVAIGNQKSRIKSLGYKKTTKLSLL